MCSVMLAERFTQAPFNQCVESTTVDIVSEELKNGKTRCAGTVARHGARLSMPSCIDAVHSTYPPACHKVRGERSASERYIVAGARCGPPAECAGKAARACVTARSSSWPCRARGSVLDRHARLRTGSIFRASAVARQAASYRRSAELLERRICRQCCCSGLHERRLASVDLAAPAICWCLQLVICARRGSFSCRSSPCADLRPRSVPGARRWPGRGVALGPCSTRPEPRCLLWYIAVRSQPGATAGSDASALVVVPRISWALGAVRLDYVIADERDHRARDCTGRPHPPGLVPQPDMAPACGWNIC